MSFQVPNHPTIWRGPIADLIAGDWVGPVACAGHALHYVAHPLLPPLQVSIGDPQRVSQPQQQTNQNWVRDLQRNVHRLEPGGTLVQREELRDVFVRVSPSDRNHGTDWKRPGIKPFAKTETLAAEPAVQWYPATPRVLHNELHGDDVVLVSGAADIFPRDVAVPPPKSITLPAFMRVSGGVVAEATDTVEVYNGGPSVGLACLTELLPRAVLERYTRVRLLIRQTHSVMEAPVWHDDARLPVACLKIGPDSSVGTDGLYWRFMFGNWAPDSFTEIDVNLGDPATFADINFQYASNPLSYIEAPNADGANVPEAGLDPQITAIMQLVGHFVLDMGEPEDGEVEHAHTQGSMGDGVTTGGQFWAALPLGIKARRVMATFDNAPAGTWFVQLAKYAYLGWAFGDQLYTAAITGVAYADVELGAGALSGPGASDSIGGVVLGVTPSSGPATGSGLQAYSVCGV